jgi:hypothetical protein
LPRGPGRSFAAGFARPQPDDPLGSFAASVSAAVHCQAGFEVVQIDHTRVDLIIVDRPHRQPLQRPWLTLGIDVASRMVAGFYLTLEAPSAMSVARAIQHIVQRKEQSVTGLDVTAAWPTSGFPEMISRQCKGIPFARASARRRRIWDRADPPPRRDTALRRPHRATDRNHDGRCRSAARYDPRGGGSTVVRLSSGCTSLETIAAAAPNALRDGSTLCAW